MMGNKTKKVIFMDLLLAPQELNLAPLGGGLAPQVKTTCLELKTGCERK